MQTVIQTVTSVGAQTGSIATGTTADNPTSGLFRPATSEERSTIVNMLREFNRIANLGMLQEACRRYFSQAFLARLPNDRACATTLAGARGGRGKVEIDVQEGTVVVSDGGTGKVNVVMGELSLSNVRYVDLRLERGEWRIDAVNSP